MRMYRHALSCFLLFSLGSAFPLRCFPQASSSSPSSASSSSRTASKTQKTAPSEPEIDPGAVVQGVYRNRSLGIVCKIPMGWVLRTDEMNSADQGGTAESQVPDTPASTEAKSGQVLLAAFSRPPGAPGPEVNSSLVIALESAKAYPGLTDAAQYFGPVTEVAQAQGFQADGEPYDFAVGAKTLARGDFQKDVGSRMMRQSTLVWLARGWLVSFTFLGANEEEVEDLVENLSFAGATKTAK